MMYFLDFDRTLFDTDAFIAHLLKREGAERYQHLDSEEKLASKLNELSEQGEISFTPEELKPFVFSDVPEFMRMVGNEGMILTFGNPALQKLKILAALEGIPRISVIYTGDVRKGEYMKERITAYGNTLLVDDRPLELEIMARDCPHVRLFEMRRDGEKGDGRWPVIHSLAELP